MSELEELKNSVLSVIPDSLLHALVGLLILLVGLFVVNIITKVCRSILKKSKFLSKHQFVVPLSSLIKGVLSIFVLITTLQHFGFTNALAPLETMLSQFLSTIPKMIGAGVIAYAGWIIATLVSELVKIALEKFDDQLEKRTGNGEIKVSKFGSAFIFGGILLPIIVAALGVLDIPAITVPASNMINELMSMVPNIVGAGIILLVTYFTAKFVIFILSGLLDGMGVNELPKKLGINGLFTASFTPIKLISSLVMFFMMLTASIASVDTLGIQTVSRIFARILDFGGSILVGSLILIIGNFLSTMAYNKLMVSSSKGLAGIARVSILGLVLAMGLKSMGLAENIVNMAFGFSIGAAAIAFALSFGLGGKEAAKKVADRWVSSLEK